jgi:Pregnancy-associated plasma protein-A/Secretion system C-terminal sorting domain
LFSKLTNKFIKMKLKLLIVLLIANFAISQQRSCGMEQQMQRIMADPIARQEYLDLQAKFEIELAKLQKNTNRAAAPAATVYIPVAVHFPTTLGTAAASLKTCLRSFAQTQVDILNADYNRTNSDYSLWSTASTSYSGIVAGVMNVQFVLATQNHPAGTGLVNGDLAVTFGTDFLTTSINCSNGCNNDATWVGYFNLVVKNISGGILGYSSLGGSLTSGGAVIIDNNAYGNGAGCTGYVPGAPYNLGRTLTHELGHFFNLDHTFAGCDSGNCNTSGDKVCDTPSSDTAEYNCPTAGSIQHCGVNTLTMNFMDYTNDACMYMFTAGQATRMTAWYNTVSGSVKTNVLANNDFLANNFSILPNPNNGSFAINLKETLNNYSVEIFDATGRTIFEKEYNQTQDLQQNISLNSSQSGIYFINIKSDSSIITKKIIIE